MTLAHSRRRSGEVRSFLGYATLIASVGLIYFWIRSYGNSLAAPVVPSVAGPGRSVSQVHVNDFVHVLLALVLVIGVARALGAVFRWVHQPPVVGEMIAGILLGPSLLGQIAPGFSAYILPQSIAPLLNVISQVGVILYMFLVGLELDVSRLRNRARSTITISHASIVVPFLLGATLALLLYPRLSDSSVSFTAFSLFLGVSMSVTAFPVLARILSDRGIHKTRMGTLTLACAAIDDVSAWCLLAFVMSIANTKAGSALPTLVMTVGYIVLMVLGVRPLIARLTRVVENSGRLTQGALAIVLLAILASSLATESIGIHSIFGAFVLGAIIPHNSSLARDIAGKLEDFVIVFLLPAFFAFTGLRTQIGLVSGLDNWLFCGLIILVASLGKFGGSAIAAKLSGFDWRDASALGILMNTRGLMELVVLNIGLELHVISPTLFAMLVLMALTTTLATTPVLHYIMPGQQLEEEASEIEAASRLAAEVNGRAGILVPLSKAAGVAKLIDIAIRATPVDGPPPRVLALARQTAGTNFGPPAETPPSRSSLLAAALDVAWARGTVITPQTLSSTDPARDIVRAAEEANVKWMLLESRRSLLGRVPLRGLITRILGRTAALPINVAVLIESMDPALSPVTCILDQTSHAAAAMAFATDLTRGREERVRVLLAGPEEQVVQMKIAAENEWKQLEPVAGAKTVSSLPQLERELPEEGLVILTRELANSWQVPLDLWARSRNVIVVQGAGPIASGSPAIATQLQPATA
jgi:Kef-type K+ transport system membrane component KefB